MQLHSVDFYLDIDTERLISSLREMGAYPLLGGLSIMSEGNLFEICDF